jgi:hypothetical protein
MQIPTTLKPIKPPLRPSPSASARLYRSSAGRYYLPQDAIRLYEVLSNLKLYVQIGLWIIGEDLVFVLNRQALLGSPTNH